MQDHGQAHGRKAYHAAESKQAPYPGKASGAQPIATGIVQRQQVVGTWCHVQGKAGRYEKHQAGKVHPSIL